MHDISLRMCMVGPRARAHGVAMCMRMAKTCTCAWLLTAQVYYWQSCIPDGRMEGTMQPRVSVTQRKNNNEISVKPMQYEQRKEKPMPCINCMIYMTHCVGTPELYV